MAKYNGERICPLFPPSRHHCTQYCARESLLILLFGVVFRPQVRHFYVGNLPLFVIMVTVLLGNLILRLWVKSGSAGCGSDNG